MTLIIAKNRQVATLGEMNRLALKRIFDKAHMTYIEEVLLEESVKQWPKKINIEPEERQALKVIMDALIGNENGNFKKIKDQMIQHGLDYRKVFEGNVAGVL